MVARFDKDFCEIFINGQFMQKTGTSGNAINLNNDEFTIGVYGQKPKGYFNGTIDEVRIYDRMLSSEQIYQNYFLREH